MDDMDKALKNPTMKDSNIIMKSLSTDNDDKPTLTDKWAEDLEDEKDHPSPSTPTLCDPCKSA